jgi:type I site-specific restriction endonuclease
MGTGKSGTAISIAEQIKSENSNMKRVMFFASSKKLYDNFKKEIVENFTQGRYIPEGFDYSLS